MGELIGDFRFATLDEVRGLIATLMLDHRGDGASRVGDVSLWPHQRSAVARLRAAIAEFGGALLADDVGTGKTFVALAIAAGYEAPLVVAPAALRESWRAAAARAGLTAAFVSFEALSRGARRDAGHDFVIVDEAHHARNPLAKRYGVLASLIAGVPTLLLTATPIHNHRADLLALLALFRGITAATIDDAALARCVVRRDRGVLTDAARLPMVRGPIPLACDAADDETPAAILALPPPVPAADAGTAAVLVAITLLRQWSSSQGALLAALRRRIAGAHALASTLDSGHWPTRAELGAWTLGDDAQQVVMTELLAPPAPPTEAPAAPAALRLAVAEHLDGLRALRSIAGRDADLDRRRAGRLRDVWRAHAGERSIAFSQFADTVDSYWRELRLEPRACAVTAAGGRVAGGAVSRPAALGSFAPGSRPASEAERIDALIVTDLASEGLDLQDASVLVHLDLPWTPARLEQRVGRIVRPGARHGIVHVYEMEPPAGAALLLGIRRRLEEKLAAARATLGTVMPDLGLGHIDSNSGIAAPRAAEELERILLRWRSQASNIASLPAQTAAAPIVVCVASERPGWLAIIDHGQRRLVAARGDEPSDDPVLIAKVATLADAALLDVRDTMPERAEAAARHAMTRLGHWLESQRAATLAGVADIPVVRARRRTLAAVARFAAAPASARARGAVSAARALSTASRPLPAAHEHDLNALSRDTRISDSALIDAIAALGGGEPTGVTIGPTLCALVVLVPDP
ncbi:MAG: helicase-related protein [Gemmatimonadaceae bacterium]